MSKKFIGEMGIKKVMDLGMKLFPNSEITETEVNDMWSGLNTTPTELDLNWKYSLDKPNTVVTLEQYIGTDPVVTVKSSYDKDDTTYNTKIASNDSSSDDYMFANNDTIETVDFEEGVSVSGKIDKMFKNCINLKSVNLSNVDLSNVTSVDGTFSGCPKLEEVYEDVNNGIPDDVTRSEMFTDSNITETTEMLNGVEVGLGPESELSNWDYTLDDDNKIITLKQYINTTNTGVIVYKSYKKGDKKYHTAIESNHSIVEPNYMFYNKNQLQRIKFYPGVDSSECTGMVSMFENCTALTTINGLEYLDTSNVTTMDTMFNGCFALTSVDLVGWDTPNVTSMESMFRECESLTSLDLTSFNVSNVTDMSAMFKNCFQLREIKASTGRYKWNVSSKCNVDDMFTNCGCSAVTKV